MAWPKLTDEIVPGRRTGRTAALKAADQLFEQIGAMTGQSRMELAQELLEGGTGGKSWWNKRAETQPSRTTLLLGLAMIAYHFVVKPFRRKLVGTELKRAVDAPLYDIVRGWVEHHETGDRKKQLVDLIDEASGYLPGLGWDPQAAEMYFGMLDLPETNTIAWLLRRAVNEETTVSSELLHESLRVFGKGPSTSGSELRRGLERIERTKKDSLDEVVGTLSGVLAADLLAMLDEKGTKALRWIDGLSTATASLFFGFSPIDWDDPPSDNTILGGLAHYRVLQEEAWRLGKSDPSVLSAPDTKSDPSALLELWRPQPTWDPLTASSNLELLAITRPVLDAVEKRIAKKIRAAVQRKVEEHGELRAARLGHDEATRKLSYLTYALAALALAGNHVDGVIQLEPVPDAAPPHRVARFWVPSEAVGVWLALGEALFGDDPLWLRTKAIALFGCRPSAAAWASDGDVGDCGRGHQLWVPGVGAKTVPGFAGACPTATAISEFGRNWFAEDGRSPKVRLLGMRERARSVDNEAEQLGLPTIGTPHQILYSLRHARARAVASALPPGLMPVLDGLLQHIDSITTFDYTGLALHQAWTCDLRRCGVSLSETWQGGVQ